MAALSSSFSSLLRLHKPSPSSPPTPHLKLHLSSSHHPSPPPLSLCLRPSNSASQNPSPILRAVNSAAKTVLLTAAAAFLLGKFPNSPARAQLPPVAVADQSNLVEETSRGEQQSSQYSPLSDFLESNSEALEALKSLLQQKLESGEDEEALSILRKLASAQPAVTEWKFLMARLLNEIGNTEEARRAFEEILEANPLSFEAVFENALFVDRYGEGEAVIERLQAALEVAESKNKAKEERDVKLIKAQIDFLQENVEDALRRCDELAKEDASDYRPHFGKE